VEAPFDVLLLLILLKQALGWVGFGIKNIGGENGATVALAVGLLKLALALQGDLELIALNEFIGRAPPFLRATGSAFSRDRNQTYLGEGVGFEGVLKAQQGFHSIGLTGKNLAAQLLELTLERLLLLFDTRLLSLITLPSLLAFD
jgi:hypothetical protein